jgi:DnaJ-class molecular chaperone
LIHHPDRSKDDGLNFIRLHSAYQILTNPRSRKRYDQEYNRVIQNNRAKTASVLTTRIPSSRMVFPENIAELARRGLLRKRYGTRERRRHLRINYDLELPLYPHELGRRLAVDIPVAARRVCPECLGSDTECSFCSGTGQIKTRVIIQITLEGGLTGGQILEINLKEIKAGHLTHFKKPSIRILISIIKVEAQSQKETVP